MGKEGWGQGSRLAGPGQQAGRVRAPGSRGKAAEEFGAPGSDCRLLRGGVCGEVGDTALSSSVA